LRNCYKCNAAHRSVCRIDESPLAPGAVSAENQRDLRVTNLRTPSAPEVTVSWALSKARSTLPLRTASSIACETEPSARLTEFSVASMRREDDVASRTLLTPLLAALSARPAAQRTRSLGVFEVESMTSSGSRGSRCELMLPSLTTLRSKSTPG